MKKIYILFSIFTCLVCVNAQGYINERKQLKEMIVKELSKAKSVSRFHNLDKTINKAYSDIVLYEKDKDANKAASAVSKIGGILDAYIELENKNASEIEISFFAREKFFKTWAALKANKLTDNTLDRGMEVCLNKLDLVQERGPNNRAANYAIGALEAVNAFPNHPKAKLWKDYAEAVWNDWYGPGDSYEPSYVSHNISRLIQLGLRLGKTEELTSEKLKQTYFRYRDHISPSGLAVTPGDGEPYDQKSYVEALKEIAGVFPDETIIWALKMAYLGGSMATGRRTESDFGKDFPQFAKLKATPPNVGAAIQYLYPATYKQPDRMILAPSRQPNVPYAAFWIQDDCNYLYHGGIGDTRGDLYHNEVDNVLLIADRGRYDAPAWNNLFIVCEPDGEFPFNQTNGTQANRWYKGSANLRVSRAFLPNNNYLDVLGAESQRGLRCKESPYGYFFGNPDALSGNNDLIDLKEVRIEFALLPKAGEKSVGKVFPGRTWWGGYESRNNCPSDVPVEVMLSNLIISGPLGEKTLIPLDKVAENIEFSFIAPDAKQKFKEEPIKEGDLQVVTDPETGKKVIKLTTRYGRTVLKVKLNEKFNLTTQYSRIELSYKYVTPISGWTRVPIQLGINGSALQNSLKLDQQQGGVITGSAAYNRNNDCYGEVSYSAIWTSDSKWNRKTLLTEEGVLLVMDEFLPGSKADGKVAGPVWHLPSSPQTGKIDGSTINWYDASILHNPETTRAFTNKFNEASKNLFVAFKAPNGSESGVQYQPKHWETNDYAVFSNCKLEINKPTCWLSVLVPHDANLSAKEFADSKSGNGLKITEKGLGEYTIELKLNNSKWNHQPLIINFNKNGEWKITRLQK